MAYKAEKVYKDFLKTAKYLLTELDHYGENQWKKVPFPNSWTIGQLFDHLLHGTEHYHIQEIQNCLAGNGESKGAKKTKGKFLFMVGSFPSVKIKGIENTPYVPSQPESPMKTKDDLYKFIKTMHALSKQIDEKKSETKTAHPSLGMLSADEWYKLIEMHFRHHLKQKKRIDSVLRKYDDEDEVEKQLVREG